MLLRHDDILAPYVRPLRRRPAMIGSLLLYVALIAYAMFAGMAVAVLPPELWMIPASPIFIAAGLILWCLPDQNTVPRVITAGLLSFFIASNYVWPSYVALNLPGLPWLNPQRLALFLLLITSLYGYATSSAMREKTLEVVRSERVMWLAFSGFWICSLAALAFSGSMMVFSFNKWVNYQIYWSFLFIIAAFLLRKPGTATVLVRALMIAGILTALISLPEYIGRSVPWIGHIPDFLIGDPEIYRSVADDHARLGLDMYRARSSFTLSITFAEFLAMCLPFLLHEFLNAKHQIRRMLMGAAILLVMISMAFWTGSRSGMNGLIIGLFGYPALWVLRRWKKDKQDLLAPTIISLSPVILGGFVTLLFVWQRLRVMTFGGGMHSFSDNAREIQWELAVQRLLSNPFGYGAGRATEVLGYTNRGGFKTIDSYYINFLLDYGVMGFVFIALLALTAVVVGLKLYLETDDKEEQWSGPIAVSVIAFIVIKSVLSQGENIPLFFTLCGAMCALSWRYKSRLSEAKERVGAVQPLVSRPANWRPSRAT